MAWKRTYYSLSLTPTSGQYYARCEGRSKCTLALGGGAGRSKGVCEVKDGMFVKWIKQPKACCCKISTFAMKKYGKHAAAIVKERCRIRDAHAEGQSLSQAVYQTRQSFS